MICEGGPGGPVVFLGTSPFAVPSLAALVAAGEAVSLVVTQPDRPRGRGRKTVAPPVKLEAERLGLEVYQPERVSDPSTVARLVAQRPEFLVVVAYGQLLKRAVLELPLRGAVNLHPSLLPRHRGPSPLAWALLAGDTEIGISTMLLDEGMDSGPVLLQESRRVAPHLTRGELEEQLAAAGSSLLVRTLSGLRRGEVEPQAQDPAAATFSHMITRELRDIGWDRPAAEVRGLVHALSPTPGAVCRLGGRLLKVLRVAVAEGTGSPGTVIGHTADGPVITCGEGAVVLLQVQPEGKRVMEGGAFARGGGAPVGSRAEEAWNGSTG